MFCTKIWMLLTVSGRFEPLGFGKQWLQWTPSLGMRSSAQSPSGECTGYLPGPHETSGSSDAWRAGWSDCKDKKANGQIQWRRQYRKKKKGGGVSYMAMLIQGIVGELKLGERWWLLHPVPSWRRRVWVRVCTTRGVGVCCSCDLPMLLFPLQRNSEVGQIQVWDFRMCIIKQTLHEPQENPTNSHMGERKKKKKSTP